MILLTINGESVELDDGSTIEQVVAARAPSQRRVAVAVNGGVVPRSAWATTPVSSGDSVEVLAAVAGG